MSNYLAIAAVTSTLSNWLYEKAAKVLDGAKTTIGRPKEGTEKGINIFLYQVTYNADHRNDDLLTRRGDGTVVQKPQAALDLFYLLTFYGTESNLEPQALLGSAVNLLHTQPILTWEMLREYMGNTPGAKDILAKFDIANRVQNIVFTPLSFNTEEFAKLWSMLFQIPYTLSVAYKASVILIEADITPQEALPVQHPDIYIMPFSRPVIDEVNSLEGQTAPIVHDSTIVITGQKLKGDTTKVRIGDVEVTIDPGDIENTVNDKKITLSLSSALFASKALRAGVQGVIVFHPMMMGEPKEEHYGVDSNVKPIIFRPTIIDSSINGTDLTIKLTPKAGKTQKVTAILNEYNPISPVPCAYLIKAPEDNGITDPAEIETDTIKFPVDKVKAHKYYLRIQVDGAESLLKMDSGFDPVNNNSQVEIS